MRHNFQDLQRYADSVGLSLARYNPGDGTRYKLIAGRGLDYFQADGIFRALRLSEVAAYLGGVAWAGGR